MVVLKRARIKLVGNGAMMKKFSCFLKIGAFFLCVDLQDV